MGSPCFTASVSGAGTFTGTGTVNFEGDLTPGNSPAAVSFGGNVSLGPDSVLHIEIGGTTPGTQYDQLNVAATLSLGGTLQVSFINGFTPAAGQTFDFLNWGSLAGAFSSIQLPVLSGLSWNATQLAAGILSLQITGDYNGNGIVDAADYTVWRDTLGSTTDLRANGDNSGASAEKLTKRTSISGRLTSATMLVAGRVRMPACPSLQRSCCSSPES